MTRIGRACLALGWGMVAGGVATANAQEAMSLGEVVVTASGHEQQIEDAPASISVIDQEKIEKRYYRNVTDALQDVPGVIVTGGGAGDNGRDISIRGMPSAYTLILVDGKRQNTRETRPNGSAGFEQDFLPPLQAIDRIEVIRGPMSTLYGSDAIGGVINIITRKVPDDWGGAVQADAIIQEDGDSGNRQSANFYVGGPLKQDLLGLQLYGKVSRRAEDEIIDGYEGKDLRNLTARLAFTPTDNQDFTLEAGAEEQTREQNVGRSGRVTGCRGGCTDSFNRYSREHYALTHQGRWDFGTTDTYIQRERAENSSREIEITNTVAKTSVVVPLGMHVVTLGASAERQELADDTTNQISDLTDVEKDIWAVFAEDEWMLTDTFALTGGLRLDHDENFDSHVSPRLYGVWNPTRNWTLKGGVSTGFRAPDLREITPDFGQVSRGGNIYGNPDLEPETSVNKEIALLYASDWGANASLTLFHNDFDDKITRVACPIDICSDGPNQFGSDPTYRINVDEAITQGVEIALSAPVSATVDVSASYTYTDSEQKSGEYKGEPLTQLPKHLFSASATWQATQNIASWARLTYRGEESQPTTGPSQRSLVAPSYTFVDAGMGYDLTDATTLNVGVYNLFDDDVNYEEYGFVEDGRRYWLGVNVEF